MRYIIHIMLMSMCKVHSIMEQHIIFVKCEPLLYNLRFINIMSMILPHIRLQLGWVKFTI